MHVVGKKTGEPRRVVDLRGLNEATIRQTHYTEPPFSQAMGVEPRTWRFTSDAWNGYHSVPLAEEDMHVTTFITPWGRLRYRVAPQGSLTSGDGFTYWYDMVIRHLLRKKKCVDDVVGWAKTLLQLFYDTAEFLTLTGDHGIIQNVKKFTWGKRELECRILADRRRGKAKRWHFVSDPGLPTPKGYNGDPQLVWFGGAGEFRLRQIGVNGTTSGLVKEKV